MDLSTSSQRSVRGSRSHTSSSDSSPQIPSTVGEVESDSIRTRSQVKKEKEKEMAEMNVADKIQERNAREQKDSGICNSVPGGVPVKEEEAEDDVEVDGCINFREIDHRIVSGVEPEVLKGVDDKSQDESLSTHIAGESDTLMADPMQDTSRNQDAAAQNEKLVVELKEAILMVEDSIVEALMGFARTGDPKYFLSKYRHFIAVKDEHGDNCVHQAVINQQIPALQDILDICALTATLDAINQHNDKHQTPICIATWLKDVEMVALLLAHKADPFIPDPRGNNCFHIAAQHGDENVMRCLTSWCKQTKTDRKLLDEHNYEGSTALHLAVLSQNRQCISELISAGAATDVTHQCTGRTPLHLAVEDNNLLTCLSLVQECADVNAQAFDGNTPLHTAVVNNSKEIVRLLSRANADPEITNYNMGDEEENEEYQDGQTAYDMAAGNAEMLKLLRETQNQHTTVKPYTVPTTNSLSNLTMETKNGLSRALDISSLDWKRLAVAFGSDHLVRAIESITSNQPNTFLLLQYIEEEGKTVDDLLSKLESIGRTDCRDFVKRQVQKSVAMRRPESSIQSSAAALVATRDLPTGDKNRYSSDATSGYLSEQISGTFNPEM